MTFDHPDFQILFDSLLRMSQSLLKIQGRTADRRDGYPGWKTSACGRRAERGTAGRQITLQLLESGLRNFAAKGTCRAAGMAIDTRLKDNNDWKDAIWMRMAEAGGKSQGVFVPYAKSWVGGFKFGHPFTAPDQLGIFVTSAAPAPTVQPNRPN